MSALRRVQLIGRNENSRSIGFTNKRIAKRHKAQNESSSMSVPVRTLQILTTLNDTSSFRPSKVSTKSKSKACPISDKPTHGSSLIVSLASLTLIAFSSSVVELIKSPNHNRKKIL